MSRLGGRFTLRPLFDIGLILRYLRRGFPPQTEFAFENARFRFIEEKKMSRLIENPNLPG